MPRLVIKDSITSGTALASGQTLRLGGFTMIARSAIKQMMTSQVIENCLHIDSEYSKRMDPAELSSLNELLDRMPPWGSPQTTIGLGLNPIKEKSNLRRSPVR